MVITIKIMEGRVRQPGFIKVQGVNLAVQLGLDVLDVVEDAVVGRLGNGQDTRLGRLVDNERVGIRNTGIAPVIMMACRMDL